MAADLVAGDKSMGSGSIKSMGSDSIDFKVIQLECFCLVRKSIESDPIDLIESDPIDLIDPDP